MNAELDKKLCENHPEIFSQRHGNMRETAMCWGFECGDGWFTLIDALCDSIDQITNNTKQYNEYITKCNKIIEELKRGDSTTFDEWYKNYLPENADRIKQEFLNSTPKPLKDVHQVVAAQVKEKYGGLRFYASGITDEINAMISFAEHMSYRICEDCGTTSNVTTEGDHWIRTLCNSCRK